MFQQMYVKTIPYFFYKVQRIYFCPFEEVKDRSAKSKRAFYREVYWDQFYFLFI